MRVGDPLAYICTPGINKQVEPAKDNLLLIILPKISCSWNLKNGLMMKTATTNQCIKNLKSKNRSNLQNNKLEKYYATAAGLLIAQMG